MPPSASGLFELTRALVDVDSTTGREREVGELLDGRLRELAGRTGGEVERMPVEGDRFNLLASWGSPEVVLSTHFDTVPPFFPSREDGEWIHGRGACDAKGAIAAMIAAIEQLLAQGVRGLGLLLVVGEETDSAGARAANASPRGARWLIDGEPTENRLALGSKGTIYLALETEGKAAHSAYPELGRSAIDEMLEALGRLRRVPLPSDPVLGEATLNIGTISGGRAANVIADRAAAEVLVRTVGTVGDSAGLEERLVEALGGSVSVVRRGGVPAVRLGSLPGFETTVVAFTTDVPRLDRWGEPFLLGPGTIHVAHTPEERVAKADLVRAAELYREMVLRLKALPRPDPSLRSG